MRNLVLINTLEEQISSSFSYSKNRFILFRNILSLQHCFDFLQYINTLPYRRVFCYSDNVSWSEQEINKNNIVFNFFYNLKSQVCDIVGQHVFHELSCWTSTYKLTEYIEPHFDRTGTTQLILCLKSTENSGGVLYLNNGNGEFNYHLNPGDCLLFEATKVKHWTTPIKVTQGNPSPIRVVAVGRYYLSHNELE